MGIGFGDLLIRGRSLRIFTVTGKTVSFFMASWDLRSGGAGSPCIGSILPAAALRAARRVRAAVANVRRIPGYA